MKPYPSYKPSGVPWLGEVPAHWDIVPIRYLSRGVKTGGTPSQEAFTDYPTENDIPWYAPADLNAAFLTTGSRVVSLDSIGEVDIFEPGTIAMVGIGDVGRVSILTTRATGNQQLNFIRPVESVLATFLTYALLAAQGFVQSRANVTLIPILNQENTKRLRMPTPPLDEQQTIATYLDRETARIDMLIAEKELLIETLREYRQATISEVVTQGLDEAAPKKPSGVPWLGEIPTHWESKAAKFLVTCNDDVLTEDVDPATEIVYVEIADVEEGQGIKATTDMLFKDAPSRARRQVKHGDIIVSTVRTYLKAIAPVENPPDNLVVSTGFAVLRPHGVSQGFAKYAFAESGFINTVIARSNGVSYPAINATDLVRIPIPVPPVVEQQSIAAYLDRETARIDKLIEHVQDEIKLLQELRAATITDAVTGKI